MNLFDLSPAAREHIVSTFAAAADEGLGARSIQDAVACR